MRLNKIHWYALQAFVIGVLSLAFAVSSAFAFGPQSSNKNVLWGFDFVEEFDGLQDWNASACRRQGDRCGDVYDVNADGLQWMPKLLDGSTSAWGYYSMWSREADTTVPWIGGETASGRQIWRGTKSGTIDLGETKRGPSRLGVWFGDDGYQDFSVFYMVHIPRNMFPTQCNGGTGTCVNSAAGEYIEGQPYIGFASYKFNTTTSNCPSADCWNGSSVYGDNHALTNIGRYGYTPGNLVLEWIGRSNSEWTRMLDGGYNLAEMLGDWFGFEFRIRNISATQYTVQAWVYDRDGNQVQVLAPMAFSNAVANPRWNRFFFGGNNAGSWLWGSSMQSWYNVDDLIIDGWDDADGPIGPRYFAAIAQDNVPVSKPNAATNFSYTTRSRDAVVAGGATRGNLTQCPDGKWATVCKATVYDVRVNCTNPSTRENGNSFLPAGIESLDWIFEPTGDAKTQSVKVQSCPFLVDLPPATYTVKQRTVLTHSGDGKVGNWSQISGSMEVPAP